mmetsp:Transcript_68055/g.101014  ORF Transcript_68055/g.101014 Transcript_68055/m.101014 type:complete len:324 (-) Transcript_68055:450-1421(-)
MAPKSLTLLLLTSIGVNAFFPSDYSNSPSLIPPRSAAAAASATNTNYYGDNVVGDDDNGSGGGGKTNPIQNDENEDDFYTGDMMGSPTLPGAALSEQHETVEDRAEAWRKYQQEKYEHQTADQIASPTDEEGRMKLLASVSRGSISFFFFILMWRSVHHFELADQAYKGVTRLFFVIPTVTLFLLNMAGCVAGFTSPNHSSKKKMKAILNLNKLGELLLMIYNVVRLTLMPNRLIPREIYVGRTLSNFIFLVQCQLFTKVTWGAAQIKQEQANTAAMSSYTSGSNEYYDNTQQQQQQQQYNGNYGEQSYSQSWGGDEDENGWN